VDCVLHPGLESHPDHALWKRDFTGANGLFSLLLKETSNDQLDRFLEAMKLFGMGFSWGGYESLLIPCDDQLDRIAGDRIHERSGPLLRVHVGLEDPDDLIADLEQAFAAMHV
jgi:cystathionine beta-lyase